MSLGCSIDPFSPLLTLWSAPKMPGCDGEFIKINELHSFLVQCLQQDSSLAQVPNFHITRHPRLELVPLFKAELQVPQRKLFRVDLDQDFRSLKVLRRAVLKSINCKIFSLMLFRVLCYELLVVVLQNFGLRFDNCDSLLFRFLLARF